jgi:DNA-binding protein H-NS
LDIYRPPKFIVERKMRGFNLTSMSVKDLVALRDDVIRTISTKSHSARRELEEKLALLERLGLGGGAFGRTARGSKLKGRKVPPKYRNPKNPSETWAGRGATPRWMRDLLKSGHKLEEFAIAKPVRKAKR